MENKQFWGLLIIALIAGVSVVFVVSNATITGRQTWIEQIFGQEAVVDVAPPTCIDSDGDNICIQGTCTFAGVTYTDYCEGGAVFEFICADYDADGIAECVHVEKPCPLGEVCSNGKCPCAAPPKACEEMKCYDAATGNKRDDLRCVERTCEEMICPGPYAYSCVERYGKCVCNIPTTQAPPECIGEPCMCVDADGKVDPGAECKHLEPSPPEPECCFPCPDRKCVNKITGKELPPHIRCIESEYAEFPPTTTFVRRPKCVCVDTTAPASPGTQARWKAVLDSECTICPPSECCFPCEERACISETTGAELPQYKCIDVDDLNKYVRVDVGQEGIPPDRKCICGREKTLDTGKVFEVIPLTKCTICPPCDGGGIPCPEMTCIDEATGKKFPDPFVCIERPEAGVEGIPPDLTDRCICVDGTPGFGPTKWKEGSKCTICPPCPSIPCEEKVCVDKTTRVAIKGAECKMFTTDPHFGEEECVCLKEGRVIEGECVLCPEPRGPSCPPCPGIPCKEKLCVDIETRIEIPGLECISPPLIYTEEEFTITATAEECYCVNGTTRKRDWTAECVICPKCPECPDCRCSGGKKCPPCPPCPSINVTVTKRDCVCGKYGCQLECGELSTESFCCADCAVCNYNGTCDYGESYICCPDCPAPNEEEYVPYARCGDKKCDEEVGETQENCCLDCGCPEVPGCKSLKCVNNRCQLTCCLFGYCCVWLGLCWYWWILIIIIIIALIIYMLRRKKKPKETRALPSGPSRKV